MDREPSDVTDPGAKSPEEIQREMESTRESLTDKVAALENQVVGSIQNATDAVTSTVESVRSAVEDTMSTVKESVTDSVTSVKDQVRTAFDFTSHVRENPWPTVTGAAVVGFITGLLVFRPRDGASRHVRNTGGALSFDTSVSGTAPRYAADVDAPRAAAASAPASSSGGFKMPSWADDLLDKAGQEIRRLGEEALATAAASARQAIQTEVPHLIESFASMRGTGAHGSSQAEPAGATGEAARHGKGFNRM